MKDKINQFHKLVLKAKTPNQIIRLFNWCDCQTDIFDICYSILVKYNKV